MDDSELSITVLESVPQELRNQECAVRVRDAIPALSRDHVECYFENEKRSGGGTIEEVFYAQSPAGHVVITFTSPQGSHSLRPLLQSLSCMVNVVSRL